MRKVLSDSQIDEIFARRRAVITDTHVVYTSGNHGSAYVNKDALYPFTEDIIDLCHTLGFRITEKLMGLKIQIPTAVVGPAVGGVVLAQRIAELFTPIDPRNRELEVPALYAEKRERGIPEPILSLVLPYLGPGETAVIKEDALVLKRGQDKLANGKKVLVVEDVLNTGGSAKKTVDAVREAGGVVIGACALVNRGNVTAEALGVPVLFTLKDVVMDAWKEEECPLCKEGVPINTDVGHGKAYLARKGRA